MEPSPRRVVAAGITAALVSGLPSTLWALMTGANPLAATRAAGTLVPGKRTSPNLIGGVLMHFAISSMWTAAFALAARRWRLNAMGGAMAGLGIAALDLGVIGRRYPAIAALPELPQWADHIVFGVALDGALRLQSANQTTTGGA